MDVSSMDLVEEIVELLEYDERTCPNWHGYVGHAAAHKNSLVISRSYAAPQEGTNQERLAITLDGGRVHLSGYDDRDRSIDSYCPLPIEKVLERVHGAAVNGHSSVECLIFAIRTGGTSGPTYHSE
jgi:hypothetical protein